jgi:hypothetical protein
MNAVLRGTVTQQFQCTYNRFPVKSIFHYLLRVQYPGCA